MDDYTLGFHEIDHNMGAVVGGKGAHLGGLWRLGSIDVPAGFCVTTHAFERVMAEAPSMADLLDRLSHLAPDHEETIRALSSEIRHILVLLPETSCRERGEVVGAAA